MNSGKNIAAQSNLYRRVQAARGNTIDDDKHQIHLGIDA